MTADRDDCPAPRHRPLLTKQQALDLLLAAARPPAEIETVPTRDALGRVLAAPLACPSLRAESALRAINTFSMPMVTGPYV